MPSNGKSRTRKLDVSEMLFGACWVVADTTSKFIAAEFEVGINLVAVCYRSQPTRDIVGIFRMKAIGMEIL